MGSYVAGINWFVSPMNTLVFDERPPDRIENVSKSRAVRHTKQPCEVFGVLQLHPTGKVGSIKVVKDVDLVGSTHSVKGSSNNTIIESYPIKAHSFTEKGPED